MLLENPAGTVLRRTRTAFILIAACLALAGTDSARGNDCTDAATSLETTTGAERIEAAFVFIRNKCLQQGDGTESSIWQAIRTGRWPNGDSLEVSDQSRAKMVKFAALAGFEPAESLAVEVLQTGTWPDESALTVQEGTILVESLEVNLSRYRVGLLLDIYEQIESTGARIAVITTLRASSRPEALLPALDAYWRHEGLLKQRANQSLALQPEDEPADMLIRLAQTLDKGPKLEWTRRLAEEQGIQEAVKAATR